MTRMLTALAALLLLPAAVVQAASAKTTLHDDDQGRFLVHGPASPHGARVPGPVREVSATAQASGDGSTASATAKCPGGTRAAGGGFNAPSSSTAVGIVYESVKVGQSAWRASVQLLEPGDPASLTLTTYAYCRKHVPRTGSSAVTVPTHGNIQNGPTASAACPAGQVALAGGFHMPPPLISPLVTDLFFDSMRSGTSGWNARVFTGPAGPSSITSEAYCAPGGNVPVEADASGQPSGLDGDTGTATANCPAGTTALDGGFAQPDSTVMSFFFVDSSRRVGDGWQVTGLHAGNDPAVALDVAAYCA